jgi:hypothetical protein
MRSGPLVVAAALLLALVGCVPTGTPSASPRPTATPVFASDAEALAAAEKAYAAYLKVSAQITAGGGLDPGRIDPLVTTKQASIEHDTYEYFSSNNLHTVGSPTFSHPKLEQMTFDNAGRADLTFYTCVDATSVRVFNASNSNVTPSNRADRTPLEVTLVSSPSSKSNLLVSESSEWSGSGVCS